MRNRTKQFWKISAGEGSIYWEDFIKFGYAALGEWDEGNLENYEGLKQKLVDRVRAYSLKRRPDKYKKGSTFGYQLWNFFKELSLGHILVLYGRNSILAFGEVTKKYWYEKAPKGECKYPHRVEVDWKLATPPINNMSQELINSLIKPSDTFHKIRSKECVDELENLFNKVSIVYLPQENSLMDPKQKRGNDWDKAECYFAIWAYDRIDSGDYTTKQDVIREVSEIIGRSEKSVEYKLQNISHFDVRPREQKPYSEKSNAQKLLGQLFKWYWSDKEVARQSYPYFLQLLNLQDNSDFKGDLSDVKDKTGKLLVEEGELIYTQLGQRKRSHKLLVEGRRHFKDIDPEKELRCRVCGYIKPIFVTREIVHLHHTVPIMEYNEKGEKTTIEQALKLMVPLCPNCHSIIHSKKPAYSVEELINNRKII